MIYNFNIMIEDKNIEDNQEVVEEQEVEAKPKAPSKKGSTSNNQENVMLTREAFGPNEIVDFKIEFGRLRNTVMRKTWFKLFWLAIPVFLLVIFLLGSDEYTGTNVFGNHKEYYGTWLFLTIIFLVWSVALGAWNAWRIYDRTKNFDLIQERLNDVEDFDGFIEFKEYVLTNQMKLVNLSTRYINDNGGSGSFWGGMLAGSVVIGGTRRSRLSRSVGSNNRKPAGKGKLGGNGGGFKSGGPKGKLTRGGGCRKPGGKPGGFKKRR